MLMAGAILFLPTAICQVLNQHEEPKAQEMPKATVVQEIKGTVKVSVDTDKKRGFLAPRALGVVAPVGDNNTIDPLMPQILQSAGVTTLRYPGGANSDNYHWSTYKPTKWQGTDQLATYGSNNDFGHFARLLDQFGTAVITVNYGSNVDGTGGGTPEEAAAWVAYAMGDPGNPKAIGKDASGHDWQTVGFWATLRGSPPLATDDGMNFLRVGHPNPVLIKYWEVGNEVYKNGYYGGEGTEEDLHAAYPKDPKENEKQRRRNRALGPDAYGNAFLQYSKAMKAADNRIKVGASLDVPLASDWNIQEWTQDPITKKWEQHASVHKDADASLDWDRNVLKIIGKDVDFVALHWYPGATTESSGWKEIDNTRTLLKPEEELPQVMSGLIELFQKYCGPNMQNMQLLVTELGITPWIKVNDEILPALFAADAYATLVEDGAANIDWAELHNNGFLNEENKPGPVYFAIQLVRRMADLNDIIVTASSSNSLLAVHAATHKDGSVGLMLINKDPKNNATVKVTVNGTKLAASGTRYDFGRSNSATQYMVPGIAANDLGNSVTITVPLYTITDLVIPKAQ
jgi:alpha-L-arabinofuranosidase